MSNNFDLIKKNLLEKVNKINAYKSTSGMANSRETLYRPLPERSKDDQANFQSVFKSFTPSKPNVNLETNVNESVVNDTNNLTNTDSTLDNNLQLTNKTNILNNSIKTVQANFPVNKQDLQYDNLNALKREVATLEEKIIIADKQDKEIEQNLQSNISMKNNLDMFELKQNFNLLLDKLNALIGTNTADKKVSSLENAMLLNTLSAGQNKPDNSKDIYALQNSFNNLANKLDYTMYNQNNSVKNSADNSSILKDLINYKLVKNLSIDDDKNYKDTSSLNKLDSKIEELQNILLKNLKNNVDVAKATDLAKINQSLNNISGLQENSLAIKSGMIDMLNKISETSGNIDLKLDNVVNKLNKNTIENAKTQNDDVEGNLYAINNKLDHLLTILGGKYAQVTTEDTIYNENDNANYATLNDLTAKIANLENKLSSLNVTKNNSTDTNSYSAKQPNTNTKEYLLNNIKPEDLKSKSTQKTIDILANMEYLQNAINKAVNNSKK